MLYIPEGDVYRLIVSSKLPGAEKFKISCPPIYVSGRKSAVKVLYLSYFHLSVKNPMYTKREYLRMIAFVILLLIKKSSGSHKEVLYHF